MDYDHKPKSTLREPPQGDEQSDFFTPQIIDHGARDARSIMDVAVFNLSKQNKRAGEIHRYDLGKGDYVEISVGPYGMATIWDYDLVLMLASHLTEANNLYKEGKAPKPPRIFKPHTADILRFCRRDYGGNQVKQLEGALDRLQNTTIKVSRQVKPSSNGGAPLYEVSAEPLIGKYQILSQTKKGRIDELSIGIPEWLYSDIVDNKNPNVLTVHPDYFLIKSGIARFLYRAARRMAGADDARWGFDTLYERSGSVSQPKKFNELVRSVIKANDLPEYVLFEEQGRKGPQLVMVNRVYDADLNGLSLQEFEDSLKSLGFSSNAIHAECMRYAKRISARAQRQIPQNEE